MADNYWSLEASNARHDSAAAARQAAEYKAAGPVSTSEIFESVKSTPQTAYIGDKTYDFDSLIEAQDTFIGKLQDGKFKGFEYNFTDPEDVARFNSGKVSKLYEAGYGDDEYSQWLKRNHLPHSEYFDTYYIPAYQSVMAERARQQNIKDYKSAIVQEAWQSAEDPMNITGDDIVAAAERVRLVNSAFGDIELFNEKTELKTLEDYADYASPELAYQEYLAGRDEKRGEGVYLTDLLNEVGGMQAQITKRHEKEQQQAAAHMEKGVEIFNAAVDGSGYATNKKGMLYEQAAIDGAASALREAGYTTDDIKTIFANDGRLNYAKSSEAKATETDRVARQEALDSTGNVLLGVGTQLVKKAQRAANMGTAALPGFSPASGSAEWRANNLLSDTEKTMLEAIMHDTRTQLEAAGYTGFEVDNYFRRQDLGEYLDSKQSAENYSRYVMANEMGMEAQAIDAVIATYTDKDIATLIDEMKYSPDVQDSTIDFVGKVAASIPTRAALSIASSVVGLADMATASVTGREDLWKATETLNEYAVLMQETGHDVNHKFLSGASDIGSEILRMYATSLLGSAAVAGASALAPSVVGTSKILKAGLSSIPFVSGAMGSYYNEAKSQGASTADATEYALLAGTMEGLIEKLSFSEATSAFVGRKLMGKLARSGNISAATKQVLMKGGHHLIDVLTAAVFEGAEEGASYLASSAIRSMTWDDDYQRDNKELLESVVMGGIMGGLISGMSSPANSQRYKYAMDIYNRTGNYNASLDSLMSAQVVESWTPAKQEQYRQQYQAGEIKADKASRKQSIEAEAQAAKAERDLNQTTKQFNKRMGDIEAEPAKQQADVDLIRQRIANVKAVSFKEKGDRIAELARQLNSAQQQAAKAMATAESRAEAARSEYQSAVDNINKRLIEATEITDAYHAAKYFTDYGMATAQEAQNAPQTAPDVAGNVVATPPIQNAAESVTEGAGEVLPLDVEDTTVVEVQEADPGYLAAVDNRIVEAVEANRRGELGYMQPIMMSPVTPSLASRISELTGLDVAGYTHGMQKDAIEHIEKRHGQQGKADRSMANAEDIGRLQYVLDNFDNIEIARKQNGNQVFSRKYKSSNGDFAPVVLISKRVDGHYYVSEAVPDAQTGTLWVTSAYINKKGASQVRHASNSDTLSYTPETELASTPDMSVPQPTAAVNPELKDLGADTPKPKEMVESRVYINTYDKWLTDAEKKADNTQNSWYARSKEKDTLASAKSIVEGSIRRNGSLDEVMAQLQDRNAWEPTDVDTAMLIAETLRSEAASTGDYTKLNEWKNVIRQNMTQSGQTVQALAKWTRNSSIAAEAALDKAVDNINKQNKRKIDQGDALPVEVNPELMAELQAAETEEQREAIINRIAADIGAKMPVGFADKLNAWRYLAMLGNPRTILRNLVGNEIMSDVLWTAKDAVGVALESGLDQSQRTKALMFGEEYKANRDYAATTLAEARNVLEGSSRYDTKRGIEKAIDESKRVFRFAPVEGARKATNWALSKGDAVFLEKQYKRSFAQIMTARGYTANTITAAQKRECMNYAIAEAQRSTFHDASKLAEGLSKIENSNALTKILVGGVLPFKKTPINVLKRGVEFSPIGLIQGTTQMLTKVKSGEVSAAEAVDKISSGLTGTALFALGAFLAKSGVITGGNEDKDKYYMSDLGAQEFALNLGDGKSMTIDWAAPATIPLFMGAALSSILEGETAGGENQFDALINTMLSITDPLVEMSMLQGLQDTLESAAKSSEENENILWSSAKAMGINYLSSYIPTVGGQIARTIDPVRRDTSGDPTSAVGKTIDKALNKAQAKIPGLADDLEPYINVWGEQEINEASWPVRLLENSVFPGYLDELDMTPVDVELTRLYSETQNPNVIPSNYPYRTLKRSNKQYVLTSTEYTQFKVDTGRAMYAAALDAINDKAYITMDDEEKASFIASAIDEAQNNVLDEYKDKYLGK